MKTFLIVLLIAFVAMRIVSSMMVQQRKKQWNKTQAPNLKQEGEITIEKTNNKNNNSDFADYEEVK